MSNNLIEGHAVAMMISQSFLTFIDGEIQHFVKGINTAASVWLSAAVGGES